MSTTQTTVTVTAPVTTKPAVKAPTVAELAAGYAEAEVKRVQEAALASLNDHPMALPADTWEYIAELLRDAYRVGAGTGSEMRMVDINTRYTLKNRG